MIKDGRNGSMPLGTSFLRKMRELPVIIRENISMHNIFFQVNIEKHLLNRSTHSNELRGANGDTQIEKI